MEHTVEVQITRPIKPIYFPVSRKLEEEMYEQVRTMLVAGIIKPSNSAFSSPEVMVRKANRKYRFCMDFRNLNAVTRSDVYPITTDERNFAKVTAGAPHLDYRSEWRISSDTPK